MKRKHLFRANALFCLLLFLFSCDKEEVIEPVEAVIPLQVGNEWVYDVIEYTSDGKVLSTSSFRRQVVKDTLIHKTTWYILNNGMIVRNDKDGYVHYRKDAREQYITYPSPEMSGIAYGYQYPNYTLWIYHRRAPGLVEVPNSSHASQAIEFSFERQTEQKASSALSTTWVKEYVTPEIGMIRTDWYYADSDKLMRRYELVNYRVQ
ncbi:hypothetical protein [Pontibacter amylolyticus]|uniref:DUF4595 domain-containing protein n=1 Tax=Pontibacter amylolyticus TaxID=1424080 RepID=A0ABQ1WHF0_9BACT|nr:hypothetical protein [Pontibacter amylolyticus]GGG30493.1 hypothetical protein GCM10011323_37450 [Pontibacter amylolyticus]